MKLKKILGTAMATGVAFSLAVMLTGCTNGKEVLDGYIFQQENLLVTESTLTELPAELTAGEDKMANVSWTSSNPDVVKVEKVDGKYTVTLNRPALNNGQVVTEEVQLTVKCGSAKKSYTVKVQSLTAEDFATAYSFAQNKKVVYEDFNLDTKTTLAGKEATITWACDSKLVTVDGGKAKVIPCTTSTAVTFTATFSYEGTTYTKKYTSNVYYQMSSEDEMIYWYNNTGVSKTLSGYVTAIAANYSESYGNVSLYMIDDNGLGGYYAYRIKCDKENGEKVAVGKHVTITGTTNQDYNGLIETNAGGKLVVDDKATKAPTVTSIDEDFIANSPNALYRESTLVSLNGWAVTKVVADKAAAGSTTTVLSLKNGSKTIDVAVSKYVQSTLDAATVTAINTKLATIKVGDIVNVSGIWSKYNNYQLLVQTADDITKTDATAVTSYADAEKVATALTKLPTLAKNYYGNASVALTAKANNLDVEYKLASEYVSAKIADGKLVITPDAGVVEDVVVLATVKSGNYTATKRITTNTVFKDEQAKVDDEATKFRLTNEYEGVTTLSAKGSIYSDVTVTYEVTAGSDIASISGTKMTIKPVTTATEVKVKATFKCGDKTATKETKFTIKELPLSTITDAAKVESGETVKVQGTVVAASAKGYAVSDGTKTIYVYAAGGTAKTVPAVGSVVEVKATKAYYKDVNPQYVPFSMTVVENGTAATEKAAVTKDTAALEKYLSTKDLPCEKITMTGTVSITFDTDGTTPKYVNIVFADSTKIQGSIADMTAAQKALFADLKGKKVEVTGYTNQLNGKYLYVILTDVKTVE